MNKNGTVIYSTISKKYLFHWKALFFQTSRSTSVLELVSVCDIWLSLGLHCSFHLIHTGMIQPGLSNTASKVKFKETAGRGKWRTNMGNSCSRWCWWDCRHFILFLGSCLRLCLRWFPLEIKATILSQQRTLKLKSRRHHALNWESLSFLIACHIKFIFGGLRFTFCLLYAINIETLDWKDF